MFSVKIIMGELFVMSSLSLWVVVLNFAFSSSMGLGWLFFVWFFGGVLAIAGAAKGCKIIIEKPKRGATKWPE